ncbi:sugar ABC transporter permease [Leptolyngbya valderiana BDU 20041]|nr:sugar ABC transporter permease [Leptolyngbya valderiana BDU 20041]
MSSVPAFNARGALAIYKFEMARFRRTLWQSVATPVLTTVLYFVVFGSAIGSRIGEINGVEYAAFIVPGLILLTVFTESLNNASFGIYMPRFTGTIYEVLSAPVSTLELVLAYVGAAATKSVLLGLIILATASLFIDLEIAHPVAMLGYLVLVAFAFSLTGFIIGVLADGFESLQFVPMLVVTPLTFLGGVFYSIEMLPQLWQTISLANPIVYIISGFRFVFFGRGDVDILISLGALAGFIVLALALVAWIIRTGYRLKS